MPILSENIKKVAVIMSGDPGGGKPTQFLELDQGRPLAAIIKDICDIWNLPEPDDHSLQFMDNQRQAYITERNRVEIQNGHVLTLTFSPAKTAQEIFEQLHYGEAEAKCLALKRLADMAPDFTFAQEFINKQGLFLIIRMVEGGSYSGESLTYILRAFIELMDHGIVSWDVLEQKFIKMVSNSVNSQRSSLNVDHLQCALEILESIILHSNGKYSIVEQEVTPMNLIHHLQSGNTEVQKNGIALINALFMKADSEKRKKISENLKTKSIRNVILGNIIRGKTTAGAEMDHQLYVLQSLMFNLLEERMMEHVDPSDQTALRQIMELKRTAFDTDNSSDLPSPAPPKKQANHAKDYRKLGFEHLTSPVEDFTRQPPGLLALDNMVYFARNHGESYRRVVLENSCRADEHDCPFTRASIDLTKMLTEILRVGEPPTEEGQAYYPMFFQHDCPFEEFYCISVQLLNKTWKEMRATAEDFMKVMSVVREQVTRALEIQPMSFDIFKTKLQQLTYTEITQIWQQERRHKEEWESQAKPIIELRQKITPETLDLIRQQRLHYLVEGTVFTKFIKGRLKDKFWFCCLSPNHKVFHYGDCDEMDKPPIEQLPNKLAVVDIKGLATGKDIPQFKEKSKKSTGPSLAFAIQTEMDMAEPPIFVAHDQVQFDIWTDGINTLLSNPMTSDLTKQDLETLLSMEIKLRLLETEGVTIPENPPPIPPPPDNYDFAYCL